MFKKSIKYIAVLVLVAFTVTFGLPTRQIAAAQQEKQTMQTRKTSSTKNDGKSKSKTRLGSFADEFYTWYEKLKTDLDTGDLNKLKSDVKDAKKALKEIRKDINRELSENKKVLQKLNAKNAEKRHGKFQTELDSKLDGFETTFTKLDELSLALKDLKNDDTTQLKAKIEEIGKLLKPEQPQQPQQPLGALPHNIVNIQPPAPATGSGLTPAYLGSTTGTAIASLPRTPTSEDLAETAEIKFTKEIQELADSLNTAVNIYEYVRNNVNFESYYGSRKGTVGTLQQMAGNDFDQASLLISMLRYKGIPARYVRGTVEIPIEKVIEWTSAETPEAAVKILASLGIPSVSLVSGGVISDVRLEHVWVEAYVPYENYRGIGQRTGKKIWVPLDPSFKQYEKIEGINLEEITGISAEEAKNAFQHGTVSLDKLAISRVETSKMKSLIDSAQTRIEEYCKAQDTANLKWQDLVGGSSIIPQKLGLLPNTLPYKTVQVIDEYTAIPDNLADHIGFSIKGADPFGLNFTGADDFVYNVRAVDLYGKRITMTYAAASPEDQAIIEQYGSIFKAPAYLVQLKPQLNIDGQVVATGNAIGMGYRQQLTIEMQQTGMSAEKITNPVTAGSIYCVGLNYSFISPAELQTSADNLKSQQNSLNEQNLFTDQAMGEILNLTAKMYFAQLDISSKVMQEKFKVKASRLISEAITGYQVNTGYMFGTPVEINEGSSYIDVDHDVYSVVSHNGDQNAEKAFMLISGIYGSNMEHEIFEQMMNVPSLSTVKIINEANERGIPIYNITKDNIAAVLPELEVGQYVKNDIVNAVNAGKQVTIPQRNIQYFDWHGTGYIVLDTSTGAAGYMISGGMAGGAMSLEEMAQEYVQMVIEGLVFILAIELAKCIATAYIPVLGTAISIFTAVLFCAAVLSISYTLYMFMATGEIFYLQEAIVQFAALATLFGAFKAIGRITENLRVVERLYRAKNDFFDTMRGKGLPDETISDYFSKYGSKNTPEASDALNTFKNQGVKTETIVEIGKCLDKDGIDTFKNILKDNSGKYTESDHVKILDLLKQCGTKAEMDAFRNTINRLNQYGIKPSDYEAKGIRDLRMAEAAVEAVTKLEASWADKLFESAAKFEDHFTRHALEWTTPLTRDQYLQKARNLLSAKLNYNVEGFVSKEGWIFKYNNATNEFAIGRPDGVISTVFRPVDGRTYWLDQIKLFGGDSVVFGGN